MSTQFSSILPIDRTLIDATIPRQSGPGCDSNENIRRIPQSFSITGTSPSDCLVSYPGHSLWEFCSSAYNHSVCSTAWADKAMTFWVCFNSMWNSNDIRFQGCFYQCILVCSYHHHNWHCLIRSLSSISMPAYCSFLFKLIYIYIYTHTHTHTHTHTYI